MRRLLRFTAISLGTGSTVLGLSLLGYYFINTPKTPATNTTAASFVHLEIQTDGVLPAPWIEFRMALEENLGLMQIDMSGVKAILETYPQIKAASVERKFPKTLCVRVQERFPVFRMKVKEASGESVVLLVDEEGFVFKNIRYPDRLINRLPYLAGVDLHRTVDGYVPIQGVACLAELFHVARTNFPDLAREWRVVYADQLIMAKSFTKGYIRVRSRGVKEILFSPKNFEKQLEKLQYILDSHGGPSVSYITRVNLSLLDQPTVEFANNFHPDTYH
ncbi:MAG: FtsQ-type POTRA domain-containing protein [Verrucomicrobia bacterium]|nr:FtsQ-type POTRA domain-containing protein [Verrucomicrobiota bacterium]